jgi:branched-chain amino acid transport system substrate-binding protein
MRNLGLTVLVLLILISSLLLTACSDAAPSRTAAANPSSIPAATAGSRPSAPTPTPVNPTVDPTKPVVTARIYASLPLSGSSKNNGQALVNAMRLALSDFTGGTGMVGNFKIEFVPLDNASAAANGPDPARESVNAYQAAADPAAIVYLGPNGTANAQVAIPILNRAGLTMISTGTTYPGLTKSIASITAADEPAKYYPTGVRNFFRLLPTDELQGRADAGYTDAKLQKRRVFVVDDGTSYGVGLSRSYEAAGPDYDLTLLGHASLTDKPDNSDQVAEQIRQAKPEVIFFGGSAQPGARLKTKLQNAGLQADFLGGGGIQSDAYLQAAGPSGEASYASLAGIAASGLSSRGAAFLKEYRDKYGDGIQGTTIYGYDAMSVGLTALRQANSPDRAAVLKQVAGLKNYAGATGRWSFDQNGDTSLTVFSFYIEKDRKWVFDSLADTSTNLQNPPAPNNGNNASGTPSPAGTLPILPPSSPNATPPATAPGRPGPATLPASSPNASDNLVDAVSNLPPDFKLYRIAGLPVTIYVPPASSLNGQPAQVLLALHGMFFNGSDFGLPLLSFARDKHLVLVAPTFNYNVKYKDPQVVTNEDLQLTRQLSQVFAQIPQAINMKVRDKLLLFGFSRGAQLGHHFAMFYPALVRGAAVLSAGAYTLPQTQFGGKPLPFPFGLSNFQPLTGHSFDMINFDKIPFDVQVGLQDDDPSQVSRPFDPYSGNNRVVRAQSFYHSLKSAGVDAILNLIPDTRHEVSPGQLAAAEAFLGAYVGNQT